jgi:hypothetical protein
MFQELTNCRAFDRNVAALERRLSREIVSPRVMRRKRLRLCYAAMRGLKVPFRRQAEFVAYRLRAGHVD